MATKGVELYCSLFLTNYSLILIDLRNAYGAVVHCCNVLAKAKAVELRQKNREELLTEIENYKKELAQVIARLSYSLCRSSVWLR